DEPLIGRGASPSVLMGIEHEHLNGSNGARECTHQRALPVASQLLHDRLITVFQTAPELSELSRAQAGDLHAQIEQSLLASIGAGFRPHRKKARDGFAIAVEKLIVDKITRAAAILVEPCHGRVQSWPHVPSEPDVKLAHCKP